jgi:hypothetical protein
VAGSNSSSSALRRCRSPRSTISAALASM